MSDLEISHDGTDWREVPEHVFTAMHEAVIESVHGCLNWNVNAYGAAWTGEYEDSRFLASGAAEKAIAALYEAGYRVVEFSRTPPRLSAKCDTAIDTDAQGEDR